jgi:hypothetical protein
LFPNHEITSRRSQAVEIDDEDALDPPWLSFSTTCKPPNISAAAASAPARGR